MTFFNRLQDETKEARNSFIARPLIQEALTNGVSADLYRDYLEQAYHHVKYTCPLLGLALAHCPIGDAVYRNALIEYIDEEKGHEEWILNDIEALGGHKDKVRNDDPNIANKIMCGYIHYAIEHISPYTFLGMVHVLEGMSVILAEKVANTIGGTIDGGEGKGFSYLKSHGALDQEHVVFFEKTVNKVVDIETQDNIIETANIIYRLWGDMFDEIQINYEEKNRAA